MSAAGDAVRQEIARRVQALRDDEAAKVLLFLDALEDARRRDMLEAMTGSRPTPDDASKRYASIDELRGDLAAQTAERKGAVWDKFDAVVRIAGERAKKGPGRR